MWISFVCTWLVRVREITKALVINCFVCAKVLNLEHWSVQCYIQEPLGTSAVILPELHIIVTLHCSRYIFVSQRVIRTAVVFRIPTLCAVCPRCMGLSTIPSSSWEVCWQQKWTVLWITPWVMELSLSLSPFLSPSPSHCHNNYYWVVLATDCSFLFNTVGSWPPL